MIIKYCPVCVGKPYSSDLSLQNCPVCKSTLQIESADEQNLIGRMQMSKSASDFGAFGGAFTKKSPPATGAFPAGNQSAVIPTVPTIPDPIYGTGDKQSNPKTDIAPKSEASDRLIPFSPSEMSDADTHDVLHSNKLSGKVSQYSCTGKEDGNYRRLLITKIIDAVVYHQRLEDVLHRFNVRVENGKDVMGYSQYSDIPVNVHGTIASGMQITDNAEVEVEGKYRNGVLMASKVSVVNNGYHSQIKFQRSVSAIIYGVLAVVAAIALIVFVANTDGNFFANLKSFLLTWLVVSVVTAVLYLVLIFSKIGFLTRMATGKPKKFPIVGILLFSLIITMIFMNSFGIGASLSGLFSKLLIAIMPTAIIIIAIIFLIKLIFK